VLDEKTPRQLAEMALNHGNLAFVRETILRTSKAAAKAKETPTAELVMSQAKLEHRARARGARLAA